MSASTAIAPNTTEAVEAGVLDLPEEGQALLGVIAEANRRMTTASVALVDSIKAKIDVNRLLDILGAAGSDPKAAVMAAAEMTAVVESAIGGIAGEFEALAGEASELGEVVGLAEEQI